METLALIAATLPSRSSLLGLLLATALLLVGGLATALTLATRRLRDRERQIIDLRDNAELFRQTFDCANMGIVHVSAAGGFLKINDAALTIFGFSRDEMLRMSLHDLILPQDREALERNLYRLFYEASPDKQRFERAYRRKDQRLVWTSVTAALAYDDTGRVKHLVVTYEDISARKEAAEQLRVQQQQVAQAARMSALGVLAGGVAHEINSPLAIIEGKARHSKRLLQQATADLTASGLETHHPSLHKLRYASDFLTTITEMTARIARVTTSLRAFSRDTDSDPYEVVAVTTIVDDALALCRERFRRKGVLLTVGVLPANLLVDCRPSEIAQILLDLLVNAFDAVHGLSDKWVEIGCRETPTEFEVTITDSGKGVDPAIVEQMMQPFFTTKPEGQGTGLGLSRARGLALAHGGDLRYDADCANTRFCLRLPKAMPQNLFRQMPTRAQS